MRSATGILTVALLVAAAGRAAAQTPPPPAHVPPPNAGTNQVGPSWSHWRAAGFIASNFDETDSADNIDGRDKLAFGGQIGYLWRGVLGGEFLADSGRAFGRSDEAFLAGPRINTYMANLVLAIPLGGDRQFQPFVSGGVGQIEMVTTLTPDLLATPKITAGEPSTHRQQSRGANIGGGVMAFAGTVGVRGDVRYYRANRIDDLSGSPGDQATQALLSDLPFWRGSIGVAFQW